MNHSFIPAKWNSTICGHMNPPCLRKESDHGIVQCESCMNVADCDVVGSILMCFDCRAKEAKTQLTVVEQIKSEPTIDDMVARIDKLAESATIKNLVENAIKGNIKQYTDFFNAKMPSVIELKRIIDSDDSIVEKDFALVKACTQRMKYLTMVLFEFRSGEIELSAEVKSIQQYINDTIPTLRTAQRAHFASINPEFIPQVIKPTTTKPRAHKMSIEDKMTESYAKAMKIPVEVARKLMANKLRDNCTCSETPGMCKVHN